MALTGIVLLIPQSTSDGHHRRTLSHAVTFEEVLEIMYDIIGCSDICRSQTLHISWHLPHQKRIPSLWAQQRTGKGAWKT
jgi:hypothetical protein